MARTKAQSFRYRRICAEYRELTQSIESIKSLLLSEDFTDAEDWDDDNGSAEYNGLQNILASMIARRDQLFKEAKVLHYA